MVILNFFKKNWIELSLTLILVFSFCLMIFSSQTDSLTTDEKVHISAGYLHVFEGNYTFNSEHPPLMNDLSGLFAEFARPKLPQIDLSQYKGADQWTYGDKFFYEGNNVNKIVFYSRIPTILLTLGLIYLVFIWARALFGPKAGLLSAALTAFSPNILAHGRLATTDMAMVFFFVLALWMLRKYILEASLKNAMWLGVATGLVILVKFSGIFILPIILCGLVYVILFRKPKLKDFLKQLAVLIIVPIFLMWIIYFFSMRSEIFDQSSSYVLSKYLYEGEISNRFLQFILMPFDKFFRGYQIVSDHNAIGHWAYLNGVVDYRGWWYYFPLVLWYKLTVPSFVLIGLAIIFFYKKHKGFIEEFLIIFPILLYLGVSMTSKIDIGVRHILPIVPLIFIFVARLATFKNIIIRPIIAGLVILHIIAGILAYPNYIAYFNQIAGGPNKGIDHLLDSNLDWNQNVKRFAKYAKENNITKVYQLCWDSGSFAYYGVQSEIVPNSPVKGVVILCAQPMIVTPDGFDLSWIKQYPYDDIIGQGIYIWRFDKKF